MIVITVLDLLVSTRRPYSLLQTALCTEYKTPTNLTLCVYTDRNISVGMSLANGNRELRQEEVPSEQFPVKEFLVS